MRQRVICRRCKKRSESSWSLLIHSFMAPIATSNRFFTWTRCLFIFPTTAQRLMKSVAPPRQFTSTRHQMGQREQLVSRTLPQQACSSQLHPQSVPAVPTTSRMMPLGCLLGSGAHALSIAITGKGAAATAWRFVQAAAHMVQYLAPLLGAEHAPHSQSKSGEEEAMVCGCGVVVVCGCLFYVEQNPTSKQQVG